jgi:3-methylcrotonyl-CoA carboxylase alpha subunit
VAIERPNRGLEETDVRGIVTHIPFLSALLTHPKVLAAAAAPGDLELTAAVAAILAEKGKAARQKARSPWHTFGWIQVGRRERMFSFRVGQGTEKQLILHYGGGPSTLVIDNREIAFASNPQKPAASM